MSCPVAGWWRPCAPPCASSGPVAALPGGETVSARELEVPRLVAAGASNGEIAARLTGP